MKKAPGFFMPGKEKETEEKKKRNNKKHTKTKTHFFTKKGEQ